MLLYLPAVWLVEAMCSSSTSSDTHVPISLQLSLQRGNASDTTTTRPPGGPTPPLLACCAQSHTARCSTAAVLHHQQRKLQLSNDLPRAGQARHARRSPLPVVPHPNRRACCGSKSQAKYHAGAQQLSRITAGTSCMGKVAKKQGTSMAPALNASCCTPQRQPLG